MRNYDIIYTHDGKGGKFLIWTDWSGKPIEPTLAELAEAAKRCFPRVPFEELRISPDETGNSIFLERKK